MLKRKLIVTMIVMCFLVASFSAVVSAAPNPQTITTDYGYGVVAHDTYIYFDSKYQAYAYIDGKALPSYYAYQDYLVSLGVGLLNGYAGIAYGAISAMTQAGYGSMLDLAKGAINNANTEHVYVMVRKLDNPRGGGFDYSYTYTVGTW